MSSVEKIGRSIAAEPPFNFFKGVVEIAKLGPWSLENLEKIFFHTEKKVNGKWTHLLNEGSGNSLTVYQNEFQHQLLITLYAKKSESLSLYKIKSFLKCNYNLIHIYKPEYRVRFNFEYRKGAIKSICLDYYYENSNDCINFEDGRLKKGDRLIDEDEITIDNIIIFVGMRE
ncbi:hypothetical protein [Leptospira inadai]|nr:hypothetical protein [Leptospira inadai]